MNGNAGTISVSKTKLIGLTLKNGEVGGESLILGMVQMVGLLNYKELVQRLDLKKSTF